jgi:hypothetical protein
MPTYYNVSSFGFEVKKGKIIPIQAAEALRVARG